MATAIETKALRVSFVYRDGRLPPTRVVTVGPAAAHEILLSGLAQIADEQSFKVYGEWCDSRDVEPVDTDDWEEEEASVAIDLRETPVRALRDALAAIDDLSVLEALAKSEDRNSAARHYKARIAELQAEDTGAGQGDG